MHRACRDQSDGKANLMSARRCNKYIRRGLPITIRKPLVVVSIAAAVAALSACSPLDDKNYHGTVSGTAAPTPISTVSTPPVVAYTVTISGSGEQVKTAELVATGYTVAYRASSNCLIAEPVLADGSDGVAVVSECAHGDGPVSGTTTYRGTGRTTFHVYNTDGSWSLTFTPLS